MVRQGIQVEGLRELLRALSRLPKTAQAEIREAAQAIADDEAKRITSAGRSSDSQSAAAAGFVKARRDRVPTLSVGGSRKAGVSGGATVGQLFFGAEFGGQKRPTTRQFRPHKGRTGYWLWPVLREDQERMLKRWQAAVEAIAREWERD